MIAHKLGSAWLGALAAACLYLMLPAPALAFNEHVTPPTTFGEPCTSSPCGPAQFTAPDGVGVEQGTGDVYVVDSGDDRVEKFTAAGGYLASFGSEGSGPEQLEHPTSVAVDEAGLTPIVYVDDQGNKRVEEFTPGGGYVGVLTGACEKIGEAAPCTQSRLVPFEEVGGVAVDPNGDLWIAAGVDVYELSASGALLDAVSSEPQLAGGEGFSHLAGIAANARGDFYGFHNFHGFYGQPGTNKGRDNLEGWTPAGNSIGSISPEEQGAQGDNVVTGVAVDPGSSGLGGQDATYVTEFRVGGQRVVSQYASDCEQEEIYYLVGGSEPKASCTQLETFGAGLFGMGPHGEQAAGVAVDASSGAVYVVQPESAEVYVFGATVVPDASTGEASGASASGVTLNGIVDADGTKVESCEFEYGTEIEHTSSGDEAKINYLYGRSVPCEQTLSTGSAPQRVSAALSGLEPDKTYHYRVVAANSGGSHAAAPRTFVASTAPVVSEESAVPAPVTSVSSVRVTVTTQINAGGLPTGYRVQYGASGTLESATPEASEGQSAEPVMVAVHLEGLRPGTEYRYRVVASNALGTSEGETLSFTTAALAPASSLLPDGRHYELVSTGDARLGNVYLVEGTLEGQPFRTSPNGEAVVYEGAPSELGGNGADANSQNVGNEYLALRGSEGWSASDITPNSSTALTTGYDGFSTDLSIGVLQSSPAPNGETYPVVSGGPRVGSFARAANGVFHVLTDELDYKGASFDFSHLIVEVEGNLYDDDDWEGANALGTAVNMLPDRSLAPEPALAAVSREGTEVVWSSQGKLYLSTEAGTPAQQVIQLDAPRGGSGAGGGASLPVGPAGESPDGRYRSFNGRQLLFTDGDSAGLTSDTVSGSGANLYLFEVSSGRLSDLTPVAHAEVQGVAGASEEDAYVYFFSAAALSGANAEGESPVSGESNLYLLHEGLTSFIAKNVSAMQVAPDGLHMLVQSNETGALYVYGAQTGRLACASCVNGAAMGVTLGNNKPSGVSRYGEERYVPRWMSSDGDRVFFQASQLLPQDTAGQAIYEWEREGSGSCQESAAGCIYLISGGSEPAEFVDASASGDDVFFTTQSRLSTEDRDDYVNVYDARVGQRPPTPPLCSGTGCQGVPFAPPIFATPASTTFNGVGNYEPSPPPTKTTSKKRSTKCREGTVRRDGRCVKRPKTKKKKKAGKGKANKTARSERGRK